MKYIKLYENFFTDFFKKKEDGITFKEWLINYPQDINTTEINCSRSNLIDLEGIQQFTNLKILNCENNKLTSLPELSDSLLSLYCNDNKLTSLPNLPNSLFGLSCSNNNLTKLPNLPNLSVLSCRNNNLIELPELPDSLDNLYCENNKLTSLPELPDSLTYLKCYNNKLTTLPELPDSLKILYCSNNNLPYTNLTEYKEWHKKTYPWIYKAKNYNI